MMTQYGIVMKCQDTVMAMQTTYSTTVNCDNMMGHSDDPVGQYVSIVQHDDEIVMTHYDRIMAQQERDKKVSTVNIVQEYTKEYYDDLRGNIIQQVTL